MQDEHHVVFECGSTITIHNNFYELVDESEGQLSRLMTLDHAEVAKFISACMKHIDDEYTRDDYTHNTEYDVGDENDKQLA